MAKPRHRRHAWLRGQDVADVGSRLSINTRMSPESRHLSIRGFVVQIVRKAIMNLHLGVSPPHGRVRVAAPPAVTDDAMRLAVVGKENLVDNQE